MSSVPSSEPSPGRLRGRLQAPLPVAAHCAGAHLRVDVHPVLRLVTSAGAGAGAGAVLVLVRNESGTPPTGTTLLLNNCLPTAGLETSGPATSDPSAPTHDRCRRQVPGVESVARPKVAKTSGSWKAVELAAPWAAVLERRPKTYGAGMAVFGCPLPGWQLIQVIRPPIRSRLRQVAR